MNPIGERVAAIESTQDQYMIWNNKQNGRLDKLDKKLENIQRWLIGVMGSVTVGLILTVVNLIAK